MAMAVADRFTPRGITQSGVGIADQRPSVAQSRSRIMLNLSLRLLAVAAVAGPLIAAETFTVADVVAGDRVVVTVGGAPVALPLAHVEIPEAQRAAAKDQLTKAAKGKAVVISFMPDYGLDANGSGKVHLLLGGADLNAALVENGLARFQPGPRTAAVDKTMKAAQDKAAKAKRGLWAADAVAAATPAPAENEAKAAPVAKAPPGGAAKGDFASELNSKYFYTAGHRALGNVNPQRLIWYKDEAAAKKAGKQAAPLEEAPAAGGGTETNADSVFSVGRELYQQAIAAGNSDARDQLYEKAFVKLSDAMNIYGALVEKDEKNEALAEKLRVCMQLRYGSVKQRRVH